MSEVSTRPFGSSIGVAVIISVVAAASVTLRVLGLEEYLATRTLILVSVVSFGAFATALIVALLGYWIASQWNPLLRAVMAALMVGGGFVPATLFSFAIENRLVEGHVEAESITDLTSIEVFWSLFGAMGMFTPPGLKYLMPWPLLAIVAATAICFYYWPQRGIGMGVKR